MTLHFRTWLMCLVVVCIFSWAIPAAAKRGDWVQLLVFVVMWCAGVFGLWTEGNKS